MKSRGGAADAIQAARALRGTGPAQFVVFALRIGRALRAVITRPVAGNQI